MRPIVLEASDISTPKNSASGAEDVEDDRLSLLAVDTLLICRLLDSQHNGRNTSAGS